MKLSLPVLVSIVSVSACSTATDSTQPAAKMTIAGEVPDAAWTERNGPSAVPRDGWVETVSGWYPSKEACRQQHRGHEAVGTPLALDEECLEPSR